MSETGRWLRHQGLDGDKRERVRPPKTGLPGPRGSRWCGRSYSCHLNSPLRFPTNNCLSFLPLCSFPLQTLAFSFDEREAARAAQFVSSCFQVLGSRRWLVWLTPSSVCTTLFSLSSEENSWVASDFQSVLSLYLAHNTPKASCAGSRAGPTYKLTHPGPVAAANSFSRS